MNKTNGLDQYLCCNGHYWESKWQLKRHLNGPCCPVPDCKSAPVWKNPVDLSDQHPGYVEMKPFCMSDDSDDVLVYRIPTAVETLNAREKDIPLVEILKHFSTH